MKLVRSAHFWTWIWIHVDSVVDICGIEDMGHVDWDLDICGLRCEHMWIWMFVDTCGIGCGYVWIECR